VVVSFTVVGTNKNCSANMFVNNDVTILISYLFMHSVLSVLSMLNDQYHNLITYNIVGRQIIINSRIKRKFFLNSISTQT